MSENISTAEFVSKVRQARKEWDSLIFSIRREEMLLPGFCGDWSLKDLIAHLSWYEQEMIRLLETHVFAGSSLWELPLDERNAAIFAQIKDLRLEQVLAQSTMISLDLINALETTTDDDLNDPARFPGMPLEWKPWQVIASNSNEHYEDHLQQVKAWLQHS
jgi:hypothetical protein